MLPMIISYASGGLGNRLKPFGTCYNLCKETGRQLGMVWNPALRCMASFKSLFENNIPNIDLKSLPVADVSIYSDPGYIHHDANLNGNNDLLNLFKSVGCKPLEEIKNIKNDPKQYIIIYNNTTTEGYDDIKEFLKWLSPVQIISDSAIHFTMTHFNMLHKPIGVHARCTDFNIPHSYYIDQMRKIDIDLKMFVCSDSKEFELEALNIFGDRVILNTDKPYVYKNNTNGGWVNNVATPQEAVQYALVDIYILAATNFLIYHPDSTFAHLAKILN